MRFKSDRPTFVSDEDERSLATHPAGLWLDVRATSAGRLQVHGEDSSSGLLSISPQPKHAIRISFRKNSDEEWSAGQEYFGRMHVSVDDDDGMRVINLVPLERYVECVVGAEVWPTFEIEAFRAQAIAVRTFVLYQMQRRQSASFDVSATQGAQVYRGIRRDATGRRAADAARDTRGQVCAWRKDGADRLFSTYYSSACGGMSQSAAIFGETDDIEPLAGGIPCRYCRIAPGSAYRWGPTQLPADEVLNRLVARYPELAKLENLVDIVPIQVTPNGRLVRVELVGSSGEKSELLAERFRLAVGPDVMRSTDCKIRVDMGAVIFSRGRGFGHGLGLCQWGMQGQALAGRSASEILRYYYPNSRLKNIEEVNDRL